MSERVAQFGEGGRLIGIYTPACGSPGPRPAVLLLNAGIIHRIGAHRLNVKLARFLAGEGFHAFRFDLSGIGDSQPSRSGAGFEAQAVEDIRAAMDWLQGQTGCREFVTVGICSGADNAYAAALVDERLRGLVMLDPYAYGTPQAKLRFHLQRVFQLRRWMHAGRRRLRLMRERIAPSALPAHAPRRRLAASYVRTPPPLGEYGLNLQRLVARGTKMYMGYSRGMYAFVNHPAQFFRVFRPYSLKQGVRVETLARADHTYTEICEQQALAKRVVDWIGKELPPARGGTPDG